MRSPALRPGSATLARRCAFGLLVGFSAFVASGCIVAKAVYAPVKLAGQTVVVAGETAGTAVVATGRLAGSALKATGSVGSTGIDSLAALSQAGMVTFVDTATGTLVRVPWAEGMQLYGGAEAAKIQTARRTIDIVRAGKLIFRALKDSPDARTIPLSAGDVVRLNSR